jgi:hypothetical protein
MAVVGAAMHKLATLIYGVLKSKRPYDAAMHVGAQAVVDAIAPETGVAAA